MSHIKIDPVEQGFDPDFANRGMFYEFAPGSLPMQILGIRDDGKILLAGSAVGVPTEPALLQFQLVQLLENGAPDPNFGANGIVTGGFKKNIHAETYGAHLLNDGKTLLIGTHYGHLAQLAFARFLADGSLDNTFGDGGIYIPPLPSASEPPQAPAALENKRNALRLATAIGPNGELVTAIGNKVRRYLSDGSEDFEFSVRLSNTHAVGVSASGSITVAGINRERKGTIARFNADGTPDLGFGDNGYSIFSIAEGGSAATLVYGLLLRDDGSLFVTGLMDTDIFDTTESKRRGILAALDSNGKPNRVFNGGKPVVTELPSGLACRWRAISATPGDHLVVVGSIGLKGSESCLIARYKINGELDSSFGDGGYRVTDIGSGREEWLSVLVQPNQKILVSGDCTFKTDPATVVRYQET
ncbi:hypothetical protein [Pseudomonas sp. FW300-N1A1]|uniref:hypothetical protein n=1 Tax=Pseudomonas sp. FW300-N1A1 TaxID=2075555 RepID=UPI00130503E0|nr:hypothetical protein [Pseudomonas sp. FW300-N1A1]